MAANMGLNPNNDGTFIRIPVPPLSEERRRDLAKTVRSKGEEAKIAVRNIRRDIKERIKKIADEESLSEDMRYESEERLQSITDDYVQRIDHLLDRKEEEIMEV